MLRIRGRLYLGRGFADEEADLGASDDEDEYGAMTAPFAAHFLFNPSSSTLHRQETPPPEKMQQRATFSGGSVQVLNNNVDEEADKMAAAMTLTQFTPPPSVWNDDDTSSGIVDLSRSGHNEALDLSTTSSVRKCDFEDIAEEDEESRSSTPSRLVILEERSSDEDASNSAWTDLGYPEKVAVDALMTLSRATYTSVN